MKKGINSTVIMQRLLGERIKQARKNAGLTRPGLVNQLENSSLRPYEEGRAYVFSDNRLKQWEYGNNPVDIEWIPALCEALGVDVGYLFGDYAEHTRTQADIVAVTGLSENAVKIIMQLDPDRLHALDAVIQSEPFLNFLGTISNCSSYRGYQGSIIKGYMVSGLNKLAGNPDPLNLFNVLKPIIDAGGDLYPMYRAKASEEADQVFISSLDIMER